MVNTVSPQPKTKDFHKSAFTNLDSRGESGKSSASRWRKRSYSGRGNGRWRLLSAAARVIGAFLLGSSGWFPGTPSIEIQQASRAVLKAVSNTLYSPDDEVGRRSAFNGLGLRSSHGIDQTALVQ